MFTICTQSVRKAIFVTDTVFWKTDYAEQEESYVARLIGGNGIYHPCMQLGLSCQKSSNIFETVVC